ncbi:MAG TPA: lysophospholipid acyltransferase family protein [Vicinamibacterales bacterium]
MTGPPKTDTPRRWTLHGLNNGAIFTATYYGVRTLPRAVSYAIGHIGTWIAWRTMPRTRDALAHNLAPLFPGEDRASLNRRALRILRSYALDVIDFLRALSTENARAMFDLVDEHGAVLKGLLAKGRGLILVTGHYGNWELGSLLIRRALDMPLTIVAMAEIDPTVNRIRREIRERLGAETIEVRQSLDTPLQIRRHLAANRVVAMLVDRHYGRDRVPVTLFGRPAWILRTPLLMAYVSGAPLLPCSIERIGPGRFSVLPSEPIFVANDRPRDEAIAHGAQQVADAIADRVRAHPEYWYHFYRYWDAQRDEYHGLD